MTEKPNRCPFESQAIDSGVIIEVDLTVSSKVERLRRALGAFIRLRSDEKMMAIRFELPQWLLRECEHTRILKHAILPYQSEIVAAEMDSRFRPYLQYQKREYAIGVARGIIETDPTRIIAAAAFQRYFNETKTVYPGSLEHLSVWIEETISDLMRSMLMTNPRIQLMQTVEGKKHVVLVIDAGGCVSLLDQQSAEISRNKNCFSVVKCPLYPKTFWRYSEKLEIFVTREADFIALSKETRRRVRSVCNTIYAEERVNVDDVMEFKAPQGLWHPEYV